jgi:hypothetical protein
MTLTNGPTGQPWADRCVSSLKIGNRIEREPLQKWQLWRLLNTGSTSANTMNYRLKHQIIPQITYYYVLIVWERINLY